MKHCRSLRYLLSAVYLLATASSVSAAATLTDPPPLHGRFFFVALDPSEPPVHGSPLRQRLYAAPADGSTPPAVVANFANASDLVVYPRQHALGVNSRSGADRGPFLVDLMAGHAYATQKALSSPTVDLFTAADWDARSSQDPAHRYLATQVTLSPDARRVAGLASGGRVCVAPIDGQEVSVCASDVTGCRGMFPTWSPDGKTLAFAGGTKGNLTACNLHEVFLMDTATGATRQLTDIPGARLNNEMRHSIVRGGDPTDHWHRTGNPVWSPDGQWLAFSSAQGIGKVHPDGTGLQLLAQGSNPTWSPDGSMLAYLGPHGHIYVCHADGSHPVEIVPRQGAHLGISDVVWVE